MMPSHRNQKVNRSRAWLPRIGTRIKPLWSRDPHVVCCGPKVAESGAADQWSWTLNVL
jgi:hypothetical protein